MTNSLPWKMALIEIDGLPINSMVIFPWQTVSQNQRVNPHWSPLVSQPWAFSWDYVPPPGSPAPWRKSGRLVFDGERCWASMKNRYPSDWYKLLHVNGEVCSQPYLDRNSQSDVISPQLKISGIYFSKKLEPKAPRKKWGLLQKVQCCPGALPETRWLELPSLASQRPSTGYFHVIFNVHPYLDPKI